MAKVILRRWPAETVTTPPPSEVHVWVIELGVPDADSAFRILDPSEIQRAQAFRVAAPRRQFVASRVGLRSILAGCLGVLPRDVGVLTADGGKPFLDPARHGSRVRFNLSHSGELALLAVGAGVEVGVDIEQLRPLPDLQQLVDRYFSPCERAAFAAMPAGRRTRAFFTTWTLKEAYLKACGDGLRRRLTAFDVAMDEDAEPRLLEVRDRPGDERRWTLVRLAPDAHCVAAVAMQRVGGLA